MFAFNLVIGVVARSFNLFQENFSDTLTAPKATAADTQGIGRQDKTFSPPLGQV
ncbi:hypothetical protein SAMN05216198_2263 [Halopseudomonas litoralis]|uniref:Uncharacterized protein n=1 Tax=Halopseudomonas litoralis TaxID=797277 RepID=A0A1H1TBZ1_9GAMM|nr:hypothetical protein [Halopseudomonas litoralis]SDS57688.1 hypothetical protein SAMN05216198_2263 [Halopseudomonas litoralis]